MFLCGCQSSVFVSLVYLRMRRAHNGRPNEAYLCCQRANNELSSANVTVEEQWHIVEIATHYEYIDISPEDLKSNVTTQERVVLVKARCRGSSRSIGMLDEHKAIEV